MGTHVIPRTFQEDCASHHNFSTFDRYILRRSHPRRMICDIIGLIWSIYFLWLSNWPAAVVSVILASGLGLYFTRNIDVDRISQTTLGRLGLLHKHPFNLALNFIGIFPLIYGIWRHSTELILIGFSIIILGHFFGWAEVNKNLKLKSRTETCHQKAAHPTSDVSGGLESGGAK